MAHPAAVDAWTQQRPPGTQEIEFATIADGDTWLAQVGGDEGPVHVTDDGGVNWSPVALGTGEIVGGGATAQDDFRIVKVVDGGAGNNALQVLSVTADGAAAPVGDPLGTGSATVSALSPVVADDGTTWVLFWDTTTATVKVGIVAPSGDTHAVAIPDPPVVGPQLQTHWASAYSLTRTEHGVRLVERAIEGGSVGAVRRTLRWDGSSLVGAESRPVVFQDGSFSLTTAGYGSWDGGGHWASTRALAVARTPGAGAARMVVLRGTRYVAQRFSPSLYRASGVRHPEDVDARDGDLVDAGDRLVGWSATAIHVQQLPLAELPSSFGALTADAVAIIGRANSLRADWGLPPLIGDSLISLAARNHSAYVARHGYNTNQDLHAESPNRAGFTGYSSVGRCQAVGTNCTAEVMSWPGNPDPVGGWLATAYHQVLPGAPQAGVVGAGEVSGGSAVMDFGTEINVLVQPYGVPQGVWRGPGQFGGEIPDPVEECRASGQRISYPVGATATLYSPVSDGRVIDLELRRRGTPAPLPGCFLPLTNGDLQLHAKGAAGVFVPDDPLVTGATYDAVGRWDAGGAVLSHSWSFIFRPDRPYDGYGDTGDSDIDLRVAVGRLLKLDRKRRVRLKVTCPRSEVSPPCTGRLTLRTRRKLARPKRRGHARIVLTRASFKLRAGQTRKVTLRLSRPNARLIRRNRRARAVILAAAARDRAGNHVQMSWKRKLVPQGSRHHIPARR